MAKTNGNDPISRINDGTGPVNNGLTKREWLAGLAMQGMLANTNGFGTFDGHTTSENVNQKAIFCIAMADALLKALNKEEQQ